MTCIRLGTTLTDAGRALQPNAERHLKSVFRIVRGLYADHPDAVAEARAILGRIEFSLDQLRYEYPHEPVPPGWTPMGWLVRLTMRAARVRYGKRVPAKIRKLITDEFRLIRERDYPFYFLTVHDIVAFARAQDPPILCQGRGFGGQFGRVLPTRRHLGRSRRVQPVVLALRVRRP